MLSVNPLSPPVQRKFFSSNKIWHVSRDRWVIHDGMPGDPLPDQGRGSLKCVKMADFRCYLLHRYACSQKKLVNYDTTWQYLIFNYTYFWYSSSFGVTWPSNLGCYTSGQRILPLTRSRLAVPFWAYFLLVNSLSSRVILILFLLHSISDTHRGAVVPSVQDVISISVNKSSWLIAEDQRQLHKDFSEHTVQLDLPWHRANPRPLVHTCTRIR